MEHSITFVGLDVRKETISVALADGSERGAARGYGEIANQPDALTKLLNKLTQAHRELHLCYAEHEQRSAARAATGSSVN